MLALRLSDLHYERHRSALHAKQFLIEDRTEQQGFERFYSKALSVHQVKGRTYVRKGSRMSSRVINEEVKPRIKSYRTDFATLCENWKNPE